MFRLGGVGRGARCKGSCSRLFLLVYGVGTLVTIFMSNDATAVVLTPAILTAVRKAKVTPLPYLFVCALIANAASFVLPISNPANLVVFHTGMPPLGTMAGRLRCAITALDCGDVCRTCGFCFVTNSAKD